MRASPALRDALVAAMLPAPGEGLPAAGDLDLSRFWPQFDAVAPLHLRLAFRAATVTLAGMLPFALGYRHSFAALDEDEREDVLQRAATIEATAALLDIVKIVVAFAYFNDAHVENVVRGRV